MHPSEPHRDEVVDHWCGRCRRWFEDMAWASLGWCPHCDAPAGPLTSDHLPDTDPPR